MTKYCSRREAAAYVIGRGLPCTAGTLAKAATVGGGPRYQRFGNRAVYTEAELDTWIEQKLGRLKASTSESE